MIPYDLYAGLQEEYRSARRPVWDFLKHGGRTFGYADLSQLERSEIFNMVKTIWNTDALFLDMRGYPKGTMILLIQYFLSVKHTNALFLFPSPHQPGQFYWFNNTVTGNAVEQYQNPVCILVDENTISQAEYTVMTLQLYQDVTVVGSQTAGSDGNVAKIFLPGGVETYMTGFGVFYPNPFNASTAITLRPKNIDDGSITVFNAGGRRIRILHAKSSEYPIVWDGRDGEGAEVASGIYILRVQTGKAVHALKVTRIR